MLSVFQRRPALVVLLAAWFMPLLLASVVEPMLERPVTLGTWFLIYSCIGAAVLGVCLNPPPVDSTLIPIPDRTVLYLAAFGGVCGLIYWYLTRNSGLSLEQTRQLLHAGDFAQTTLESYLFQVGGAVSFLSIVLSAQTSRPLLYLPAITGFSVACWIGLMLNTGGRIMAMEMVGMALCCGVVRYPRLVISVRGVAVIIALLIPLLALNIMFVQKRMETLFADPAFADVMISKSTSLLGNQEGSLFSGDFITTGTWMVLQFTSDPIFYLDYFRSLDFSNYHFGLYQFSLLANRIPGYDWQERRFELDALYEPLGIYWNVWGTVIRDATIDFSEFGAVLMFFAVGWLTGRMGLSRLPTGRLLHLFGILWLMFSPFLSIIPHRALQVYLILALGGHWILLRKTRALESRTRARKPSREAPTPPPSRLLPGDDDGSSWPPLAKNP